MSTVRDPYFFRGSPTPGEISGCGVCETPRAYCGTRKRGSCTDNSIQYERMLIKVGKIKIRLENSGILAICQKMVGQIRPKDVKNSACKFF